MKATMLVPVDLLGTQLSLRKGQKVIVMEASNIPGPVTGSPMTVYFVRPVRLTGVWRGANRDDSILVNAHEFTPSPNRCLPPLCRCAGGGNARPHDAKANTSTTP